MKIELKTLDEIDPRQLAYHANDPTISYYLRNSFPYPYTLDNAMLFITHSLEHHALNFGIVVDGECIGCVGANFHKDIYVRNCEIGYWIGRRYWGQGITTQVIKMICPYLFDNFSITKIYAEVFLENVASALVLEKCGFEKEGHLKDHAYRNGQYYDIVVYGLRKEIYGD